MTDHTLTARLERLEIRVAYQDETIETLNTTITAQWREIDRLTRLFGQLDDRLREAESRPAGPPQSEPPPPHY
ncbi:MAG: SlyX protein [Proteobacteria bacterium]|nr:MAG: SlyX protein [Pseudomonadota bacterium]